MKISDLRQAHAKAATELQGLVAVGGDAYTTKRTEVQGLVDQIGRSEEAQRLSATTAQPVEGQEHAGRVFASVKNSPYEKDRTLVVAASAKMIRVGGNIFSGLEASKAIYGESHPVTEMMGASLKALVTSDGPSGGFIVPPDYSADVIELLRAKVVVRRAGPRELPMPRGTMTVPKQTGAATATYGSEAAAIPASKPAFGQIKASFKKLTGIVPIGNDMLRYANPAADAIVRDDLIKVVSLREDKAFLRGDGTQDTPKGFRTFVQSTSILTSADSFDLSTVTAELAGAVVKLTGADVPMDKPVWFMNPRTLEFLWWLQNSQGFYVFRDELEKGTLRQYPFFTTTQIPTNLSNGTHSDCSEIYLVDMAQAMIFDSMQLELAVSQEAHYIDENGAPVSAFQNDISLIRAITENDFQMRHDEAVALINDVRWAPPTS